MKTIIAGSRHFNRVANYELECVIEDIIKENIILITQVVSGDAKGIDQLGSKIAHKLGIPVKVFPAEWNDIANKPKHEIRYNRYGAYWVKAGMHRNSIMRDYADVLIAIWDGKSKGTKDMIDKMIKAKKPTVVVKIEDTIHNVSYEVM